MSMSVAAWKKHAGKESDLQIALIQYLDMRIVRNCWWFSIPNGGSRNMITGVSLKRQGTRRGVADLCFMLSEGRTCWLELKHGKGRQSQEQKDFQEICSMLGHPYAVANSLDEAIKILRTWGVLK